MLVLDVLNFVTQNPPVGVDFLSHHFQVERANMQMVLDLLVVNGKIKKNSFGSPCCSNGKKCGSCVIDKLDLYDAL